MENIFPFFFEFFPVSGTVIPTVIAWQPQIGFLIVFFGQSFSYPLGIFLTFFVNVVESPHACVNYQECPHKKTKVRLK